MLPFAAGCGRCIVTPLPPATGITLLPWIARLRASWASWRAPCPRAASRYGSLPGSGANDSLAAARLAGGARSGAWSTLDAAKRTAGAPGASVKVDDSFGTQVELWAEQRERLARVIGPTDFHTVNAAFEDLAHMRSAVGDAGAAKHPDGGIGVILRDPYLDSRVWNLKQAIDITDKAGRRLRDRPFARWRQRRRLRDKAARRPPRPRLPSGGGPS